MPRHIFPLAFLLGCCPCPQVPESTCYPAPACVLDVVGQPPADAGTPCGDGQCDGDGLCCEVR